MGDSPTRLLAGHSGAALLLLRRNGVSLVRKSARTSAQNARLQAQCEKLQAARQAGLPCPAVLQAGFTDGLFGFEMEYLPGETLANAVISGRQLDWPALAAVLQGLLSHYQASAGEKIPAAAFWAKLGAIAAQCSTNPVLAGAWPQLQAAFGVMRAMGWEGLPQSDCHGDFTLENIMLRADGGLALLDFDVPEQASWMLDAGKLYQDLYGHWCLRHLAATQPESAALLNAQMRLHSAAQALDHVLAPMLPGGAAQLRQLACFHLLRTLPYVREAALADYVAARVQALLR